MAGLTRDPSDPRLGHGVDREPRDQHEVYLTDSGYGKFIRPVRRSYVHVRGAACGVVTRMGVELAETYARNPRFYGATYCVGCRMHLAVGEFDWDGTDEAVGS